MRLALLFPGQGAQRPGMLAALRADPVTAAVLAEAADALDSDLAQLDTASALAGTEATQLALLIAGVAGARLLEQHGIVPDVVAGHSIGAFAAAVHAQVVSFADALRLVALRGAAMAQAYPHGFGMAAFSGVPETLLQGWITGARESGAILYLANRNAPHQFTVSGATADLDALVAQAHRHGAPLATRLAVAVPSHSPLLAEVATRMQAALEKIPLHPPRLPCVANRTARVLMDARAIAEDLALGVAAPVRWYEATAALYERGVRCFVEMPPGDTLTRLAQATFDDARCIALERASLPGVLAILQRGG